VGDFFTTVVLLVFFAPSNAGAVATIEFSNMKACREAAIDLKQDWVIQGWRPQTVFTTCIVKQ
jgi:hypothetical protein